LKSPRRRRRRRRQWRAREERRRRKTRRNHQVRRERWVRRVARVVERVVLVGETKLGCQEEEVGSKSRRRIGVRGGPVEGERERG